MKRAARSVGALALLVCVVAAAPVDVMKKAGLRAIHGAPILSLDFDGDGKLEHVVSATVVQPWSTAKYSAPLAEATWEKPIPPQRSGEKVLAVSGLGKAVWALRYAVYERSTVLRHGSVPREYRDCWTDRTRDALLVGREDAAGVIAWKGRGFTWIQCGD